jgi:hypothetical protein
MFVYNRGKLIRTIVPITKEEFILRLTHVTSGMNIEVTYDIDVQNSEKPYKVYREENGVYSIYEEFFRKGKTIKENFEEAILFFEDNIYKLMKETPPVDDTQRPDDNKQKPETFNEVPVVGDIVRVGDKFGIVTDVIDTKVTVKKMSKEEAMRILKNQNNALIATSIQDVEMAFGGGIDRIPSTNPITWDNTFQIGDKVRVRIDFANATDVNTVNIISKVVKDYVAQSKRKENPSGLLYDLRNGETWEGKDLELVTDSVKIEKKSKNNSDDAFAEYDVDKDNVVILRVQPPKKSPPEGGLPPEPDDENQKPEPVPKNVENPFDENQNQKPNDDDKKDEAKKDIGNKDKGEKGEKGEGEKGEGEKGEDGNGEDSGQDGKDGKDGKGEEGEEGEEVEEENGKDSGQEGKDGKGGNSEGEDFGDDDEEGEGNGKPSLEELMKKIQKEFEDGQSSSDIELKQDMEILEKALSTPKEQIKDTFKTKALALTAIGRANIFGTDNEKRLNEALNEIFK